MSKIKSSLKSKDGMALPMVLLVMVVLTLFGTALYMLAWNSFMTVRHMDDRNKAYYFARAGVEFAAYAYQNAELDAQNATDSTVKANAKGIIDFLDVEGANSKVTTNTIYVVPDQDGGTGKWKGLSFSKDPVPNAIGEFTVEVGNGKDYVDVTDSNNNTTQTPVTVKVFRSQAKSYVKGSQDYVSSVASAYLTKTEAVKPLTFYDDNGVLSTASYTATDQVTESDKLSKFLKIHKSININGADIEPSSNRKFFIFRMLEVLRKSIIKSIFEAFYGSQVDIDIYTKSADGNLILSKPKDSSFIKTREKAHNYYIFATPEDLFLSDCGLNVVPTKGYYNSVGLYGDEIVVDGDIIMGVYYVKTSGFGSNINAIVQTLGNRYRLGTVMIGEGSNYLTTRRDPVPVDEGGLKMSGVSVPANKIYFNGNVYVKIFNQGGSTETYRVFSAGDMAYFYGGYSEVGTDPNDVDSAGNAKEVEAKGIDLLKYFLDAVIDGQEGFNYGTSLVEKAKVINELYYMGEVSDDAYANRHKYEEGKVDPTPYFNDQTVLVRKIQVKYENNGEVEVDGGYGSVLDLIQPSNVGSTNIKWGIPEGGSVFNPIEGNTY